MFGEFDYVVWVVIPVLIFLARMVDVTLATLRHILIYKGLRRIVPILAFVEVTVWLVAITQVMQNLNNWACFLAFAFGFSTGTYVGMLIEEKLALGYQLVRVVMNSDSAEFLAGINKEMYGVTSIKAQGARGGVEVFLIVSERKRLKKLLKVIESLNPVPFYTIEDVRTVALRPFGPNLVPGAFAMEGNVKKK